ncbi:MAG: hypothetical protein JNL79_20290 [Myxococcales bacterium]|nr:hypothetical protein [Myxococcales bacterium]
MQATPHDLRRVPPWSLRLIAGFFGLFPFRFLSTLGAAIGFLAGSVLRIRRAHVVAAMQRAGVAAPERSASQMYRGLGASLLELVWLSARRRRGALPFVRIDHRERFDEARRLGRGVIVATAHTGNWDLVACACANETKLAVITRRLSARGLDALWQDTRARRGVDLLPAPDGGVLAAARARLAGGAAVAVLVDQDPERTHGVVFAPFLGEEAAHDTLPATLAARSGAPLVLALGGRRGGHHVTIEEVFVPPPRAGRAWIDETTRAMAARLEAYVRAAPEEWLWMHRRWKTQRATTTAGSVTSPAG